MGELLARGRTADVYALGPDEVVKVLRPGFADELIRIEADKMRAVAGAGVPAPRVLDVTVHSGRPALVLERIDGASMLGQMLDRPWQLVAMARLLGDLHADMAAVHIDALPDLKSRLAERIAGVAALSAETTQIILARLADLPDGDALCHGDFHPDNIILSPLGPVIIDWPDARRGPAASDAARSQLLLSLAAPTRDLGLVHRVLVARARKLFNWTYSARYGRRTGIGPELIAAWTPIAAAARLAESVDGEEEQLMALLDAALKG